MSRMDEVDYKIFGDDMQYVEVELDPGEATVAEAGGMMYMEDALKWRLSLEMDRNKEVVFSMRSWGRASDC